MHKLLVICGPTATGKTTLAIKLAKKLNGELVSADSRQVYKGLDIGTGKDLPVISNYQFPITNLKKRGIGCYEVNGVRIWGYDLADAKDDFSVAHYLDFANLVIDNILKRKKLPIVVGGTGLYIKAIVDEIPTINTPPDKKLRRSLSGKNADELFEILATVAPLKAASLNQSDKKNPRRLVRAIEIASSQYKFKSKNKNFVITKNYNTLFVGLSAPKDILNEKIKKRIEERIKLGFENEVLELLKGGIGFNYQSMQSLGYRQYSNFYYGKIPRDKFINNWFLGEVNYAKRQMTWFKKEKRITWFDVSEKGWLEKVSKKVDDWYNRTLFKKSTSLSQLNRLK